MKKSADDVDEQDMLRDVFDDAEEHTVGDALERGPTATTRDEELVLKLFLMGLLLRLVLSPVVKRGSKSSKWTHSSSLCRQNSFLVASM